MTHQRRSKGSRDCRTFERVDRRAFDRLIDEGRARGFEVSAPNGVFLYKGFEVEYEFDEERRTLRICLVKKPALLPAAMVWTFLEKIAARYEAGEFDAPTQRSRGEPPDVA